MSVRSAGTSLSLDSPAATRRRCFLYRRRSALARLASSRFRSVAMRCFSAASRSRLAALRFRFASLRARLASPMTLLGSFGGGAGTASSPLVSQSSLLLLTSWCGRWGRAVAFRAFVWFAVGLLRLDYFLDGAADDQSESVAIVAVLGLRLLRGHIVFIPVVGGASTLVSSALPLTNPASLGRGWARWDAGVSITLSVSPLSLHSPHSSSPFICVFIFVEQPGG